MNIGTTTPSEQADERYVACVDAAEAALNVADLFDELTESECRQLVADALLGRASLIFADAAERIIRRQSGELLAEATRLARRTPLRVQLWDEVRCD